MTELKPWYLSKTIWASIVTIAAAVASLSGVELQPLDAPALSDQLLQAVTAISGVIAILGRLAANSRIL